MNCNLPILSNAFANARFWAMALLFIFQNLLFSQTFEAKTDAKEVALGSTFEVSFSLKDALGERFKAPDLADFKIVGGPNEMRGMTIVNGRSTSHQAWSYVLEPRRTGTFTIGAASIVADGKTLTTKPLTIKVVPPKAKPNTNIPPGAADNLFIVGELDRPAAYVGEQVTWRVRLYTQISIEGADIIELPDFEGFYSKEKRRFDTRLTYQTIRGKKYAVKTLYEEALFPQETGDLAVGAAKVRVGVEQPLGTFGAFFGAKPVILQTQPLTLKAKPLPTPMPEGFSGSVGHYEWEVETDRDSLSTDDALTLKISVRGDGDSKRFAPPKLALPVGLEAFEPKIVEEEEYENGEEVVHSKVLEYVILPKEPGEYSLPVSLVYFDPDTNHYRTLTADSLPLIRVTAGKNYRSSQPSGDSLNLPPPVVLPENDFLQKAQEWLRSPLLWSILASFVSLYSIYFLLKKRKKTAFAEASPGTLATSRFAGKTARERLAAASRLLNSGNSRAFYDELFKTLQGYLATRLDLTPAQITQENVRKMLTVRGVSSGTIQNLLAVWQTCEHALFAGQTQSAHMESTLRMAESVVQDLEKTYRRG